MTFSNIVNTPAFPPFLRSKKRAAPSLVVGSEPPSPPASLYNPKSRPLRSCLRNSSEIKRNQENTNPNSSAEETSIVADCDSVPSIVASQLPPLQTESPTQQSEAEPLEAQPQPQPLPSLLQSQEAQVLFCVSDAFAPSSILPKLDTKKQLDQALMIHQHNLNTQQTQVQQGETEEEQAAVSQQLSQSLPAIPYPSLPSIDDELTYPLRSFSCSEIKRHRRKVSWSDLDLGEPLVKLHKYHGKWDRRPITLDIKAEKERWMFLYRLSLVFLALLYAIIFCCFMFKLYKSKMSEMSDNPSDSSNLSAQEILEILTRGLISVLLPGLNSPSTTLSSSPQ